MGVVVEASHCQVDGAGGGGDNTGPVAAVRVAQEEEEEEAVGASHCCNEAGYGFVGGAPMIVDYHK